MNKKLIKVSFVCAGLGLATEIFKRGCCAYKRNNPKSRKTTHAMQIADFMLKGLSIMTSTSIGTIIINNLIFGKEK